MVSAIDILSAAGVINLIFLFLILSSCRCIGFWKLTRWLFNDESYQRFYRLHCLFWYGLLLSVLTHAILAIYLFGIPFLN